MKYMYWWDLKNDLKYASFTSILRVGVSFNAFVRGGQYTNKNMLYSLAACRALIVEAM